jgi:hypothetical protein
VHKANDDDARRFVSWLEIAKELEAGGEEPPAETKKARVPPRANTTAAIPFAKRKPPETGD